MIKVDLSNEPNWLSGKGKVNLAAIRRKHRAVYVALREHVVKPATPETRARLEAAVAAARSKAQDKIEALKVQLEARIREEKAKSGQDPHAQHIIRTFMEAINILDASESQIRDAVESDLMDVAGINRTKVGSVVGAGKALAVKIAAIREQHIKAAFRHLRDNLPSDI